MLELTTLGSFKITYNDVTVDSAAFNSEVLEKLFVYMVLHREAPVETSNIASALWSETVTKNPAGALKNLFYRMRTLLKQYYPDTNFFITTRGYYSWNPEIECYVDCEKFEVYSENGRKSGDYEKNKFYLRKAIELYGDDFMKHLTGNQWIGMLRNYYHTVYLSSVKLLCQMQYQAGEYEELFKICTDALRIDYFEEMLYYYLIMVSVRSKNLKNGMDTYNQALSTLRKGLGVNRFEMLDSAYEQLLTLSRNDEVLGIQELKNELIESRDEKPLFCGFEVFKEIFQMQCRQRNASGYAGTLLLFSVNMSFDPFQGKMEHYKAERIVDRFGDCLNISLRRGDVVSKLSDYQYVVMLNGCKIEDAGSVIERINCIFERNYPQYMDAQIKCQIEKINDEVRL